MRRAATRFVLLMAALLAGCGNEAPKFQLTDITGAGFGRDFQLTDHNGKQQHQVQNRVAKRGLCETVAVVTVDSDRVVEKHRAERDRGEEVNQPAHARGKWQQRHREQQDRVEQHVQPGELVAVGHRQHRHAGFRVLELAIERERPEMRWRPGENDQEQQQCLIRDVARHRRPAQHRRHRARGAADHDVLRRHRLQHDGVDDRVADEGSKRKPHRQCIDLEVEQRQTCPPQRRCEYQRLHLGKLAAWQRPPAGTRHQRIDFALDQAVDCGGGAGHQRDADGGGERRRGKAHIEHAKRHRQKHADHGAEHDERNYARLGQRQKLRQSRGCLLPGQSSHLGGAAEKDGVYHQHRKQQKRGDVQSHSGVNYYIDKGQSPCNEGGLRYYHPDPRSLQSPRDTVRRCQLIKRSPHIARRFCLRFNAIRGR